MQRMHRTPLIDQRTAWIAGLSLWFGLSIVGAAQADLIRRSPARGYPEIAGDVSGSQTYSFDPVTKTGTFRVVNSPHALELGPQNPEMIPIQPNLDGTLEQSLRVVLDEKGRLVDRPGNSFQLRGTVVIGDRTYDGVLLEGRPISFGARTQLGSPGHSTMDAFDLNMKITGGRLADVFGRDVYLRIIPQADSTFRGEFTSDFSSEKPLTDLRPSTEGLRRPLPVPEPATILVFLVGGIIILLSRLLGDSEIH